jgi:hypothetical protein
MCTCSCGKSIETYAISLYLGTQSCGCIQREITSKRATVHGKYGIPEYLVWAAMKRRCNNTKTKDYPGYGGRGIKVCKEWDSFDQFIIDMGQRPTSKHSIDRINNDEGYSKDNCRWATAKEQANNTRRNKEKKEDKNDPA